MNVLRCLFLTIALLHASCIFAEDRLMRGTEHWLGYASSDSKSFTRCGGKADTVQNGDKIEKNVTEKCDSTTAYEPPEIRYMALLDTYNASHQTKSVSVILANAVESLNADPQRVLLIRGGTAGTDFERFATVVPFAIDAVVPVSNVPGVPSLRFTADILAKIFSGKITRWNDPAIEAVNPGAGLPGIQIVPVRLSDQAATTTLFVSFLKSAQPFAFATAATLDSDTDVVAFLRKNPGAIGYVDMMAAVREGIDYGAVKNPSGQFVKASGTTLLAASKSTISGSRILINAPAVDAYPITAYAFAAVAKDGGWSPADATRWLVGEGRNHVQEIGLTPVPADVLARVPPTNHR
jgi:phosphate transport system substrate-binding protein